VPILARLTVGGSGKTSTRHLHASIPLLGSKGRGCSDRCLEEAACAIARRFWATVTRVSVIIAAYNAEEFLDEALGSIFAQTYDDWEIVLADDCSSDRTAEIAGGYGHRVKVVQTSENSGPAAARNLAVANASGELLVPLDADDYWLSAFLQEQVRLYDASQGVDKPVGIVACDARLLGPDGTLSQRTYAELVPFPSALTLTKLLMSNPIFVSALIPRRIFEEVGGQCSDVDLAPVADWDLWIRVVERGYQAIANRRPLAVYRITPGSLSSDQLVLARASQRVYVRALERDNLTPLQRHVARRELRLQRATESVHEVLRRRAERDRGAFAAAVRALPTVALAIAQHPHRWPSYLWRLMGRTSSASPVRQEWR
jgi:teichuronic acid biosynthesis glycosyltransferase TuaG